MTITIYKLWQLILKAGPMVWPLLIISVAVVVIAIDRLIQLRRVLKNNDIVLKQIIALLKTNDFKKAIQDLEENPTALGMILRAGILRSGSGREEILAVMQSAYDIQAFKLKEKLNILLMASHLAPMIGFLGSVSGLVTVFNAINIRAAALNPMTVPDIAFGLWQAMLTTVFGLAIGIVAYALYSLSAHIINKVLVDWERIIQEFLLFFIASQQEVIYDEDDKNVLS